MNYEDYVLTEDELVEKYFPHNNSECQKFPKSEWKLSVRNDETCWGYWRWAREKIISARIEFLSKNGIE